MSPVTPAAGRPVGATPELVRRITGWVGVAFAVAAALSLATAGAAPGTDATGAAVELYAIDHYHAQQASLMLDTLGSFLFLIFAGNLAARLRRADAITGESWGPIFLIGSVGGVVLRLSADALQGAYQELSHSGAVPAQILELFHVRNGLVAASGAALAAGLAAVGVSGILNGSIPVPLAWVALVAGGVYLVGVGGLGTARTTFGLVALVASVLLLVWVLAVSLWLLSGPDRERAPS